MTQAWLEWATALGTIAAAVVPFTLWLIERRDRKAAEAELRQREAVDLADAVEWQAREVFVWKIPGRFDDEADGVMMLNTSKVPIFDVALYAYGTRTKRNAMDQDSFTHVVLPGVRFGASADFSIDDDVWIAFRDASGREWARSQLGTLVADPDREAMYETPPAKSASHPS